MSAQWKPALYHFILPPDSDSTEEKICCKANPLGRVPLPPTQGWHSWLTPSPGCYNWHLNRHTHTLPNMPNLTDIKTHSHTPLPICQIPSSYHPLWSLPPFIAKLHNKVAYTCSLHFLLSHSSFSQLSTAFQLPLHQTLSSRYHQCLLERSSRGHISVFILARSHIHKRIWPFWPLPPPWNILPAPPPA